MQTAPATRLAIDLMCDYGLEHLDFGFNRSKRTLGHTEFSVNRMTREATAQKISLSSPILPFLNEDRVQNTMLHEIAHVMAGFHANHNSEWRRIFLSIGGDGKALDDSLPLDIWRSIRKYRLICPVDNKIIKYADRKTNTLWRCSYHRAEAAWITQN